MLWSNIWICAPEYSIFEIVVPILHNILIIIVVIWCPVTLPAVGRPSTRPRTKPSSQSPLQQQVGGLHDHLDSSPYTTTCSIIVNNEELF